MRGRTSTPTTSPIPSRYTRGTNGRLIEVDGVAYTWDANGNLLNDGVSTYTYDHANRLTSVVQGSDTYTFAYNGLGDRLQQTVNGIPTNYTLDLNVGLTQVLDDGINDYLYGLGRIGEEQPSGWYYHLVDALGSVRQLTDVSGAVILTQCYKPFGDVLSSEGSASTAFQFTGEQRDGTGLVYLRARYYDPFSGRFINRDIREGVLYQPISLNKWIYAQSNPIIYTDPSGHLPAQQEIPATHVYDDRNITWWLYQELTTNSKTQYVIKIRALMNGSLFDRRDGLMAFMYLEKDKAKWDFKHKLFDEFVDAIALLDYQHGFRWYEYSVPGNIHYGYVGRAAGIPEWLLHIGASYAEITDPAHEELEEITGLWFVNLHYNIDIGCLFHIHIDTYMNFEWALTLFDHPLDWNAVELGMRMYNAHPNGLSFYEYVASITVAGDSLDKPAVEPEWGWRNPKGGWPYSVSRFDGPDAEKNEPIIWGYLNR